MGMQMSENIMERELSEILDNIEDTVPTAKIEGLVLVSIEGLPIASTFKETNVELNSELVAAMAATLYSLGEQVVGELGKGKLKGVFVHGREGYILVGRVGESALVMMLSRKDAQIGILLYGLQKAAERLQKFI